MGAAPAVTAAEPERRPPNIIVVITDDQSPEPDPLGRNPGGVFAYYGFSGGDAYTPHLDRLASQGAVFTAANVACPVCSPSRYTLLTGRHASRSQGPQFLAAFPPGWPTRPALNVDVGLDEPNMAKLLRSHGYRTGFVGKSHMVRHDALERKHWVEAGLEEYPIDADIHDPEVSAKMSRNHAWWAEQVRQMGFDWADAVYAANHRELFLHEAEVHNIEWTTAAALEFIDASKDVPFFLWYATTLEHGPHPSWGPEDNLKFGLDADPAITGEGIVEPDYGFMPNRAEIKAMAAQAARSPRHAYMTQIDAAMKAITDRLQQHGIERDTIFLFTSDHGNNGGGKSTLYEGGMRVPLLISWPGHIPPGTRHDGLISNIDIAPTLLDLAGVPLPEDYPVDGISYRSVLLEARTQPLREHVFGEMGFARAVKTDRWKYIAIRYPQRVQQQIDRGEKFDGLKGEKLDRPYLTNNPSLGSLGAKGNPHYFEADQLFDLAADPGERNNLAEQQPNVLAQMQRLLQEELDRFEGRPFRVLPAGAARSEPR